MSSGSGCGSKGCSGLGDAWGVGLWCLQMFRRRGSGMGLHDGSSKSTGQP